MSIAPIITFKAGQCELDVSLIAKLRRTNNLR
jgi:hypothetical protein